MQFHIPQYIDIEDKLFGPLTLKQAIYVAGGAGGVYLVWRVVPYLVIKAPIILGIAVFTWALAFFPREKLGRPFIEVLESGFQYMLRDKLYIWKKTTKEAKAGKEEEFIGSQPLFTPVVPSGKLSNASFKLDVRGPEQIPEKELTKSVKL
ncbi:MAG: PrgI family protein [Minisyncoccia bacterium]